MNIKSFSFENPARTSEPNDAGRPISSFFANLILAKCSEGPHVMTLASLNQSVGLYYR